MVGLMPSLSGTLVYTRQRKGRGGAPTDTPPFLRFIPSPSPLMVGRSNLQYHPSRQDTKRAIRFIRLKMHLPGIGVMTDCVLFCHDEKEGLPQRGVF